MKTLRTLILAATAAAFVVLASTVMPLLPVNAQTSLASFYTNAEPVSAAIAADDTEAALIVRYVGGASGLVAVAAGGDITFTDGVASSEVATDTFECPVSGALGGVIDVSDTACNTMGEVCDIINASSDWRCVPHATLRSDSSNDTLLTISATQANQTGGLALARDTDVAFNAQAVLFPETNLGTYIEGFRSGGINFVTNPFIGKRTIVTYANATSTYGSGTSIFSIVSVAVNNRSSATRAGTETVTTLYSAAGGATTANKEFNLPDIGVIGKRNQKILARLVNSAAAATVTLNVSGYTVPVP